MATLAACDSGGDAPASASVVGIPPPDAGSAPPVTAYLPLPDAGSSPPVTAYLAPPDAGSSPPVAAAPPTGASSPPPVAAGPAPVTPSPPPNRAPSIGGNPSKSVLAGATFSFRPTASDLDGDPLAFTVVNAPRWASFNTRNGRLFGGTGAVDIGRYDRIRISVSDGVSHRSLPAFSIDVVATAHGTITLSWLPATEREDGSPLTDLDAHKIYWGPAEGLYPSSVLIDNPGITTYIIDGLVAGAYWVVATTIDGKGVESEFSAPVRVTIIL
jgi:hypothetical protein